MDDIDRRRLLAGTGAIALTGLDGDASATLLHRFGRRSLASRATAELVGRSGGNPLFLREIGQLVAAEGADAGLAVPAVIRELITRRVERLPEPVIDLLSRAAVLGRDIDLDLLVATEHARDGLSEDAVLDALDVALVAGVLDMPAPGALRFAHALTRDTLHARLAPLRRQRLHLDVLGVLERDHPDRIEALAHHAAAGLNSRTASRAIAHLEIAARAAAAIGVHTDAVRHARAALDALALLPDDVPKRLQLLRILGSGLAASGDVAGARAVRREAVELAEQRGTDRDVAEQLTWNTPTVWNIRPLGTVEHDLVDRLERALLAGTADDRLGIQLLTSLVLETESSSLNPRAEEAAAEAVQLARALGDPALVCQALNAAYLLTSPPRPPAGHWQVGDELLAASREAGLVGYEAVAHHVLFGAAAGDGDLAGAQVQVDLAVRCADAGQLPLLLGVSALFGGVSKLVTGDLDGAEATYLAVAQAMADAKDPNAAVMHTLLRFTVAHARGDASALVPDLTELLAAEQIPARDLLIRAALDAGDVDRARDLWPGITPLAHSYLWDFFAAVRAQNAAELGDLDQCRASYDELAPFAGRFAGLSSGSMTLGSVDFFLGLTANRLGDLAAARKHVDNAKALATSHGHRDWARQADRALG